MNNASFKIEVFFIFNRLHKMDTTYPFKITFNNSINGITMYDTNLTIKIELSMKTGEILQFIQGREEFDASNEIQQTYLTEIIKRSFEKLDDIAKLKIKNFNYISQIQHVMKKLKNIRELIGIGNNNNDEHQINTQLMIPTKNICGVLSVMHDFQQNYFNNVESSQ